MYTEIRKCRVCGQGRMTSVLSLGQQCLTGVFPKRADEPVTRGPLELAFCESCGLLQLKHSFSPDEMYGDNYGYRSGLNASMVRHLTQKARGLQALASPADGDLVVDIGSNDGTSLGAYGANLSRLGIDPTGDKFRKHYPEGVELASTFFSADVVEALRPGKKAKIVTSIAMFYDLESPVDFVSDIARILDDEGIWHFEQSYMPSMLRTNAYDTICHEHLEFYSLHVVRDILARCGLRIMDVQMNAVNGGSFAVTACKEGASHASNQPVIDWLLRQEDDMQLNTTRPYNEFRDRVFRHGRNLKDLIEALVDDGKTIVGYGASTKGNVLLQFCGLDARHIRCIAEVNEEKFGSFTPGSRIPIVSEADARAMKPDYFLVFPWHFKHGILEREKDFIAAGGKFIFPLPEIEII